MVLSAILQMRTFITYEDDAAPFRKLDDLILAFELGMKALVVLRARKGLNGHRLNQLLELFLDSTFVDEKKAVAKLCTQYENAKFPSSASLRYGRIMKGWFLQPKDLVLKPLENLCIALNRDLYDLIDNLVFLRVTWN